MVAAGQVTIDAIRSMANIMTTVRSVVLSIIKRSAKGARKKEILFGGFNIV